MFSSNGSQAGNDDVNYIENVFSTHLYTGNGTVQKINNGIQIGSGNAWTFDSDGINTGSFYAGKGRINTFTIEFHFVKSGGGDNQWAICTSQGFYTSNPNDGFLFGIYTTGGTPKISIAGTGFGGYGWSGSTTIADNTLYHVSINFNGTTLSVYLNGVLETTFEGTTTFSGAYALLDSFMIGGGLTETGATPYITFSGTIGPLSVYNSVQRTGNFTPPSLALPEVVGKGGLVWVKKRSAVQFNILQDTTRGAGYLFYSNATTASGYDAPSATTFTPTGFVTGSDSNVNEVSSLYTSWTFREQPKFFDVVSFTAPSSGSLTVNHNLGSAPGFIMLKGNNVESDWLIYHRSTGSGNYLSLNNSNGATSYPSIWANVTSTSFQVTAGVEVNANDTYIAYLFAHDAGGFGLTGTDNVISCGSFATDANGISSVTLGYEPQFLLVKRSTDTGDWLMFDSIRGMPNGSDSRYTRANTSAAEEASYRINLSATGFTTDQFSINSTFIYIAIRRGSMKIPTDATKVFTPVAYTGTNADYRLVNTGIVTDMVMARIRTASSTGGFYTADRLRANYFLGTKVTSAEATDADSFMTPTNGFGNSFSTMDGFGVGNDVTRQLNQSSTSQLAYAFKRAAGFFDEVCYTGTGNPITLSHSLGVAPELILYKSRSNTYSWIVQSSALSSVTDSYLILNGANAEGSISDVWRTPTATTFGVALSGNFSEANYSGATYVSYLFATCAGVSKVGSYTGTGTLTTINCGFAGGARFVLIKQIDSTGSWYVWDTSRGMISGTNPELVLDGTVAETNANSVYTIATGFQLLASPNAPVNTSGGSYIFLAIA